MKPTSSDRRLLSVGVLIASLSLAGVTFAQEDAADDEEAEVVPEQDREELREGELEGKERRREQEQ